MPGSVAEFLVCHFFHNPNHIFNLSLHRHKQAGFKLANKATEKGTTTQGLLVSTEQALGWWNCATVYPAAASKTGLGPALWPGILSLGIAPPSCCEANVLFMSLSSSFLFLNVVYYHCHEEKCLKQLTYPGREKTWHPDDLKRDWVQPFVLSSLSSGHFMMCCPIVFPTEGKAEWRFPPFHSPNWQQFIPAVTPFSLVSRQVLYTE